jgi:hypothetical protein
MLRLKTGYRSQPLRSTYAGIEQRWLLIYSEPRCVQVKGTMRTQWLKPSEQETRAFRKLCRTDFACEADAPTAVNTFENKVSALTLHEVAIRPLLHSEQPGRPQQGEVPITVTYRIAGAPASSLAAHEARLIQQSMLDRGHQ